MSATTFLAFLLLILQDGQWQHFVTLMQTSYLWFGLDL